MGLWPGEAITRDFLMGYERGQGRALILRQVWGLEEDITTDKEVIGAYVPTEPPSEDTALVHGRVPGGLFSDMPVLTDAPSVLSHFTMVEDPAGESSMECLTKEDAVADYSMALICYCDVICRS